MTILAILICAGICLYINLQNDKYTAAIQMGALYPPRVKNGEYWRLLASGFVHISPYHLLCNLYGLYNLRWLERYFGIIPFTIILLGSVIGGSLLTYKVGKRNTVTVGISGGIYGLIAVYVLLLLRIPNISMGDIIQMFLPMILVNFMPNISVTGHLGGFITGLIMGIILGA